jgi:hypothetical protein
MTKKSVAALAASLMMAFSCISPAFAAENKAELSGDAIITPFYVHINQASTSLEISGGTAYITGTVEKTSSGKSIYLNCVLQKQSGSSWTSVQQWSASSSGNSATLSKSYSVSSGTYRVRMYYYVTAADGSVESDTMYSKTATC